MFFKDEYEDLRSRITKVLETQDVPSKCLDGVNGFAHGSSDVRNHSSVVKVMKIAPKKEQLRIVMIVMVNFVRIFLNLREKQSQMNGVVSSR